MYVFGHLGISLLLYAPIAAWYMHADATTTAVLGGVVMLVLAPLPDVDEYTELLAHRGITHSVWFAGFVGLVLGSVAAIVGSLAPIAADPVLLGVQLGILGTLAILGHLAGDVITPMGIKPFAPLSEWHYTFEFTYSKEPRANQLFLGSGLLATAIAIGVSVI